MRIFGRSDAGMLRSENQDAFGECALRGGGRFAIVCDGMGGEKGGKMAAEICVSTFLSSLKDADMPDEEELKDILLSANTEVLATALKSGYTRTGTTLVLAAATSDTLTLLWVGDSRAYLMQGDSLVRLTRDHSYVQELVDLGRISEAEARTHEKRHLVTRAVGADAVVFPDVRTVPWSEGDRLLLCSDGLFSMVEEKEITEILKEEHTPARTVHELVCAANSHGGEDNITVMLLENTKESYPDA